MYTQAKVFDTKLLTYGKPIKITKPWSGEVVYGLIQSCTYERLYYVTCDDLSPINNFIGVNEDYIIEIIS